MSDAGMYQAVRFVAAALAMLGRLAGGVSLTTADSPKILAQQSVSCADALLSELGLTKDQP